MIPRVKKHINIFTVYFDAIYQTVTRTTMWPFIL